MSKLAMSSTQDEVFGEVEIKAPIERVFDALTRQDQLIRWFTDPGCPAEVWEFDPRAGGRPMALRDRRWRQARERGH